MVVPTKSSINEYEQYWDKEDHNERSLKHEFQSDREVRF